MFAGRLLSETSSFAFVSKVLWKIREDTAVAMFTQMEQGLSSLASSVVCSEGVQ